MNTSSLDRFIFLISGVYKNLKRNVESLLKPVGLTFAQYGLLLAAGKSNSSSQKEIADELDTDTTNTTVICDALEKKGFITRRPNPADRRAKVIVVTAKGGKALQQANEIIETYRSRLIDEIPLSAFETTLPVLEKTYGFIKG